MTSCQWNKSPFAQAKLNFLFNFATCVLCVVTFLSVPSNEAKAAAAKPQPTRAVSSPQTKIGKVSTKPPTASAPTAPKTGGEKTSKPQQPELSRQESPTPGGDFGGGQKALEIRGQSRKLDMLQTLKNQDDDIDYVKPRKNYKHEIGTTLD